MKNIKIYTDELPEISLPRRMAMPVFGAIARNQGCTKALQDVIRRYKILSALARGYVRAYVVS